MSTLELSIAGRDLTIHQSPAVLTSNRTGGTTGAGKVTRALVVPDEDYLTPPAEPKSCLEDHAPLRRMDQLIQKPTLQLRTPGSKVPRCRDGLWHLRSCWLAPRAAHWELRSDRSTLRYEARRAEHHREPRHKT